MSFLRDLVTDQSCDDGSASGAGAASSAAVRASANPLSQLFRQFFDTTRNQQYINELSQDDSFYGSASSSGASSAAASAATAAPLPSADASAAIASLPPQARNKLSSRSHVMARHLFPDKSEDFIDDMLRKSLSIDSTGQTSSVMRPSSSGAFNFLGGGGRSAASAGQRFDEDLDISGVGQQQEGDFDQQGFNEFFDGNQIDMAYEKYLDLMRQSMSMESLQSSTEPYVFSVEMSQNPYAQQQNAYDLGMRLWKQGDVTKAIMAFEAQVHQEPHNAEAWRMLGTCLAECDDDQAAIRAMTNAVDADPNNLSALLDLGVCYTNELNKMRALIYLKAWIERHPSYAHLIKEGSQQHQEGGDAASAGQDGESILMSYFHLSQEVLDLFVRASQQNPQDSDLHTVLGVLYNIANDYDSAVQHFQRATELRPDDYALWNKLGATLANSSHSKEAVDMYRHALKLKPNYVRAWINLGIAYANQKKNEDAVKFYLRALSMCPHADSVWQYLGMALTVMDREDLVDLCRHRDVEQFRPHFNF